MNLELNSLLSNLLGMVYRCRNDLDWTMDYVSDGCLDLTGYAPEEIIHNRAISYGQIIHPADRQRIWELVEAAINERKAFDLTYRIITKFGTEKWVRELGRATPANQGDVFALEGFITEITDRKLNEQRIQRQLERMEALQRIEQAITASFDLRVTLDVLSEQVISQLEVDAADVLLVNSQSQVLEFGSSRGFKTGNHYELRLHFGEGYGGKVAMERRMYHIPVIGTSEDDYVRAKQYASESFVTYFGVPLIAKGVVKGVLEIFHRSQLETDWEWLDFLEMIARQAATAIENATLFQDLQRSNINLSMAYEATLKGWARALELRGIEPRGHAQRVIELTVQISQRIGLKAEEIQYIRQGALLHDIGTMGVPEQIMLKPGPLNEAEWDLVRQHPSFAYELLAPIDYLRPALDIPQYHHEKWDGSGYPFGLHGEQIPLAARIFAVIDVWDSLLSDRPFRKAWPKEMVLSYIHEQKGKHFDPKIIKEFLKAI